MDRLAAIEPYVSIGSREPDMAVWTVHVFLGWRVHVFLGRFCTSHHLCLDNEDDALAVIAVLDELLVVYRLTCVSDNH